MMFRGINAFFVADIALRSRFAITGDRHRRLQWNDVLMIAALHIVLADDVFQCNGTVSHQNAGTRQRVR